MSKKIYKYQLEITGGVQEISIPEGGKFLSVQEQNGVISMWFLVNYNADESERYFVVHGTGHTIYNGDVLHCGTVQIDGFVWHIFEVL